MQFSILAAVAFGGALGSLLRYFVASAIQSPASAGFPWGIFIVNITGGFVMGILTELMALKLNVGMELRAFLTVGILGGYTTFSTFSLESAILIQRGAYGLAAFYISGSALLSIAALFAGLWLVRAL
jgi:fluoride exporter